MKQKIPGGALCLGFEGPMAATEFVQKDDKKVPQLNMTVYSGGIIQNHWWWDDLLLDLKGAKFLKSKFPILENHITSLKIGFHNGPLLTDGSLRVDPAKAFFVSTPESEQFQTLSAEGFPYQASARVNPRVIERIKEGEFSEANGIKLKGPGTIFRKWEFIEGSVCVFGYDQNTKSASFSQDPVEIDCDCFEGDASKKYFFFRNKNTEVQKTMDLQKLSKEHPDLVKQIQDEAVAGAQQGLQSQFDEKLNTVTATVTQLQATVENQAKTIDALSKQNKELEKENALRSENEMSAEAGRIWVAKLSKSSVPEHMHEKIQNHVQHGAFIGENGDCDWAKFTEAVDAEIKDWETRLSKGQSSVHGGGYSRRQSEGGESDDTELQAEEDWVNNMVALATDDDGGE